MPKGTESIKVTQLQEFKNAATTPLRGIESVHSVPPYNTESHQPLYSKEMITQKVSKDWEGFNS